MGFFADYSRVESIFPEETFVSLFAKGGAGKVAETNSSLDAVRRRAHSKVTANLAVIYAGVVPATVPGAVSELLIGCELAWVEYYAYKRKPSIAYKIDRDFLKDLYREAKESVDRLKDAIEMVAPDDNPPEAQPDNVGGITTANGPRVVLDQLDGTLNGDF